MSNPNLLNNNLHKDMEFDNIPETPEELFPFFLTNINNAIANNVDYNFETEKDKFIENFLEELIFSMFNDTVFRISMLDIPEDICFKRNSDNIICMSIGNSENLSPVSQARYSEAKKIFKNPQNAVACIYFCESEEGKNIGYLINFAYSEKASERLSLLYTKVIGDYLQIKDIYSVKDFRKVFAQNYNSFKKENQIV